MKSEKEQAEKENVQIVPRNNSYRTRINHTRRTVEQEFQTDQRRASQQDNDNLRLFRREVTLLKTLKHINIVEMIDANESVDGFAVIRLKCTDGVSLDKIISSPEYGYTANTILSYSIQILNAIIYLHWNGVLHRDLKPKNIMIENLENVKVIDFETSKMGETSTFTLGTESYRPPESLTFGNDKISYDEKGDAYAFGITLWEMIMRDSFVGFHPKGFKKINYQVKLREPLLRCAIEFSELVEISTAHSHELRGPPEALLKHCRKIEQDGCFDQYAVKPTYELNRKVILPPEGLGIDAHESITPPQISTNSGQYFGMGIRVELLEALPDSTTNSHVARSSTDSSSSIRFERGGMRRSRKREQRSDILIPAKKYSSEVDRVDEGIMRELTVYDLNKEIAELKKLLKERTEYKDKIDELQKLLREETESKRQIREELEQTKKKLSDLTRNFRNLQNENSAIMNDKGKLYDRNWVRRPDVDPREYIYS